MPLFTAKHHCHNNCISLARRFSAPAINFCLLVCIIDVLSSNQQSQKHTMMFILRTKPNKCTLRLSEVYAWYNRSFLPLPNLIFRIFPLNRLHKCLFYRKSLSTVFWAGRPSKDRYKVIIVTMCTALGLFSWLYWCYFVDHMVWNIVNIFSLLKTSVMTGPTSMGR